MLAVSWFDDCIVVNISHALTDGTGTYEFLRTLLYYYCSEYYDVELDRDGVRLVGDMITQEEWEDPVADLPDTSLDGGGEILPSFSPELEMRRAVDTETVFGITFDESDFMRFTSANDGSPGTISALFLSRAIAAVHPDLDRPIRISMCVNHGTGF